MHKDIKYNNFVFRMLPVDIENFKERALQVALGSVKLEDETQWRLKNDTVHVFSIYEEFLREIEEDKLREFMSKVKSEFLE